jgi:Spy/CpxP family protein refolding chaperone
MNPLRYGVFGLALVLAASVALPAGAQDEKKGRDKGKLFERLSELIPADAVEKLKLTDEQKEKFTKLQKEYTEKQKAAFENSRDAIKKAFEDKDREAVKKAFEESKTAVEKVRNEFFDKASGLLTDEQKKKLEEIKKDRPNIGGFNPGNRPEGRPGAGGPAAPGQVLPPALQEQLKLTDEQKEKLAKLQKETEGKLMDLLTDEQKKKLEELKRNAPSTGAPSTRRRQKD